MNESSPEDLAWAVTELNARNLHVVIESLAMFDRVIGAGGFEIDSEDNALFHLVYPLTCHAIEQVKAARVLMDSGFAYPAMVNARAALEHAVTVQWLIHTHESEQQLAAELQRRFDAEVEGLATFADLPTELTAEDPTRALLPKSQGPAKTFEQMCKRFSPANVKAFYSPYRRLSNTVHPSYATIDQHLDMVFNPDGLAQTRGLKPKSDPSPHPDLLAAMAMSSVFAINALESIRKGRPNLAEIEGLALRYQVPKDLAADDTEPHLRRPPRGT